MSSVPSTSRFLRSSGSILKWVAVLFHEESPPKYYCCNIEKVKGDDIYEGAITEIKWSDGNYYPAIIKIIGKNNLVSIII